MLCSDPRFPHTVKECAPLQAVCRPEPCTSGKMQTKPPCGAMCAFSGLLQAYVGLVQAELLYVGAERRLTDQCQKQAKILTLRACHQIKSVPTSGRHLLSGMSRICAVLYDLTSHTTQKHCLPRKCCNTVKAPVQRTRYDNVPDVR